MRDYLTGRNCLHFFVLPSIHFFLSSLVSFQSFIYSSINLQQLLQLSLSRKALWPGKNRGEFYHSVFILDLFLTSLVNFPLPRFSFFSCPIVFVLWSQPSTFPIFYFQNYTIGLDSNCSITNFMLGS